jgi:glycosyltransferase involved in cell wall biosynthesis
MKITFVMSSGFGLYGGDRVIAIYAARLKKRGHDVFLISRPVSRPSLHDQVRSLQKGQGWIPMPKKSASHAEYICRAPEDKLKEIYSQCDAWLFGTRIEGYGLPILEAMACRTPVIGTPAGAAPELLVDGAGVLVKPEDPEDMARAIEHICSLSDSDWRVMSDAA